ncbi:putative aldouronate transport system permease protein [Paenibacillus sp. UNCCL117]|uniref:carbohydrate ABC transporter permease n=1 Tax=unclassified Paenibacillus TaxID=185978 RepID=UPI00088BD342|nr:MULTISPECIES: carbohydrate ABC transporter permease [unclassified Paenibacillus]SDE45784.1 putative aldouronate transport system permease protein [Paenibacillus sp. cl123]SFW65997.1 putative aldouronate transport system permease protein [Paenibacillus sp. UNCCL117]
MVNRFTKTDAVIYFILTLSCVITLLPVLHVLSSSLSDPTAIHTSTIMLYPKQLTFGAYEYIFATPALIRAFLITVTITVVGTFLNLVFTVSAAYALSKRQLPGLRYFMILIIIVMNFHAGLIPGYLNVKSLGLLNSIWAMIIPGLVSAFNLILMRNFFMDLPEEIEESARIDGCKEFAIILKILIPLSLPAIATIGLFYGVGHWNEFFKGIFYITDSRKWPLQVLLKAIVFDGNFTTLAGAETESLKIEPANVQAAAIIFATIPIVLVYPFLQKHFVKGIVMGAVKG